MKNEKKKLIKINKNRSSMKTNYNLPKKKKREESRQPLKN